LEVPTDDKILGAATAVPARRQRVVDCCRSYDNKVHCVDASNGKEVWTYETDNYINGSPSVSGGNIIFGGCDGMLHVVSLANGKKIRSMEIGNYIAGTAALDGDLAYVGHYGNEVVCANIRTGKVIWTYRNRQFPYFSSPSVTPDRVVLGGRDKQVHCINRQTGKGIWTFRTRAKWIAHRLPVTARLL